MLVPLSVWLLAASLAQSPAPGAADAGWLKAVPADIDVAIHCRGVDATRADLAAMLKILSPALAAKTEEALTEPLAQFRKKFGEAAAQTSFTALFRIPAPGDDAKPTGVIVAPNADYPGILRKTEGGEKIELKPQAGGYDAFKTPGGNPGYAVKGAGFVAFGPDETLIAAIAKPSQKTLGKTLTPELARHFLSGDVGVYVNASALAARFAEPIDQARQTLMGILDQAGEQAGNASAMNAAKDIYGALFDSIKDADALALSLNVGAKGLSVGGILTVKADSTMAKTVASSTTGTAADLGKLPSDSAFYIYMNMDAKTVNKLQGMSLRMINPGGKLTPGQAKAQALLEKIGRLETAGGASFDGGMRMMNVSHVADARKFIEASLANLQAMKGGEGLAGVYKDLKIESNVGTHRGVTFNHVIATIDLEKLTQLSPNNPATAAAMKSMFGGETLHSWFGTDGKRVFQITEPAWPGVKARIDAFLDGHARIGESRGFQSVRSQLPEQASLLVILSSQGVVRMFANQLAATLNKPELKAPQDLPKEDVFLGASLTPRRPAGYEFHLVIPSQAGPIFEKGLVPLFQSIKPPDNP